MTRKELFYFSNSDLMVCVKIDEVENKAEYHTHRITNSFEQRVVEKYISENILNVGEIFKELEVIAIGVDTTLMIEYKKFAEKGIIGKKTDRNRNRNIFEEAMTGAARLSKALKSKESEITEAVQDLLTSANDSLWFDRLGDILRDRNENHPDNRTWRLIELQEAVLEYNKTVKKDKHIKLEDLIKNSK